MVASVLEVGMFHRSGKNRITKGRGGAPIGCEIIKGAPGMCKALQCPPAYLSGEAPASY